MPRLTGIPALRPRKADRAVPAALPAPVELSGDERDGLLDLARTVVAVAANVAPSSAIEAALARHRSIDRRAAAFVTLTRDGELRGCIGHMDASEQVIRSVVEAATWATLGDPRFASVRAEELPGLHLEVSVLGPLVRMVDPLAFRLGVDGIVVERGGRRGLLLPEVATMHAMGQTAMLDTTCRKAGLPVGSWRDRESAVFAFRTDRFGGPALTGEPVQIHP